MQIVVVDLMRLITMTMSIKIFHLWLQELTQNNRAVDQVTREGGE